MLLLNTKYELQPLQSIKSFNHGMP
ncbi:unnamed protein product [Chironomus riparius]|uniref:Uncharacterized protein n=1 Tax=Chironomus riparius TaxID=315576 RepID=A0A9N9RLM2_9DIPT|nr:unnamed protein product [Chironomus riparius]